MKIFTSVIAFLLFLGTAFSQNCATVNSSYFTNPSTDGVTWNLTINWGASGTKHIDVTVYSAGSVILNTCLPVHNGTGTEVYTNLNAPGGASSLYATLELKTGNCGGGASCGTILVYAPTGGPLPITISSFYAKRNSNTVSLNWTTETEINSKEFIIERNAGNDFIPVGTVTSLNNANGSAYSFTDQNISKTVSQYRLKLVDIDGRVKYSDTRVVKGTQAESDFTIYPNPGNATTKVYITDLSGTTFVDLMDNAGKLIKRATLKNTNAVPLGNLQKGLYFIKVTNSTTGVAVTKKMAVIN
jgi:hypothetical protein